MEVWPRKAFKEFAFGWTVLRLKYSSGRIWCFYCKPNRYSKSPKFIAKNNEQRLIKLFIIYFVNLLLMNNSQLFLKAKKPNVNSRSINWEICHLRETAWLPNLKILSSNLCRCLPLTGYEDLEAKWSQCKWPLSKTRNIFKSENDFKNKSIFRS